MASHRALFNRDGLVADQSLTAMAHRSDFNSNSKLWVIILARVLAYQIIILHVVWLTNRQLTRAPHC